MKSNESISNSNCESESLALVEPTQKLSETFECYLQNSQPSVKMPPVSNSPVSSLYTKLYVYFVCVYVFMCKITVKRIILCYIHYTHCNCIFTLFEIGAVFRGGYNGLG